MQDRIHIDESHELATLLFQTRDALLKARQSELKECDISVIQSGALYFASVLEQSPSPAKLSRLLFREPHSMFVLLNNLEKQGLLKKIKDPKRKHQAQVKITKKGEKAQRCSLETWKVIREIMSCLSPEQRANLKECLYTLRDEAVRRLGVKGRLPFP